jgi:hypothetical protein
MSGGAAISSSFVSKGRTDKAPERRDQSDHMLNVG